MTLANQLAILESLGLLRAAPAQPEGEYEFRHALIQDAAYASLLKQDRRRLHQLAGETLERVYADHRDEYAPVLAAHFAEAGDAPRALNYYRIAGERAAMMYALPEAASHYTSAIQISEGLGQPAARLYRARGSVYETLGDFERARADFDAALRLARGAGDARAEWETLLDMGLLWAERDYARTRQCYERALELAQGLDDPGALAHSRNRMGNWYLNAEQPQTAMGYHEQALAAFEALGDAPGIAATLDLLGITSFLAADLVRGAQYYRRAIDLFEKLGDRRGVASALATLSGRNAYISYAVDMPAGHLSEGLRDAECARDIARQIGWRAGEVEALCTIGACCASLGRYREAFEAAQTGTAIAEAIGHRQWTIYSEVVLGGLYLDLFSLPAAQRHLEKARGLADEIGSLYWMRITASVLAMVYALQGQIERAGRVLNATLDSAAAVETSAQRHVWCAQGEVALQAGDAMRALDIAVKIGGAANHPEPSRLPALRVCQLRGEALCALGRFDEAADALCEAHEIAAATGGQVLDWRILVSLGKAYHGQGRKVESRQALASARAIVHAITANAPDDLLRDSFLHGAAKMMHFR